MAQDLMKIDLNPGIVKTVEWLRNHGFETCDSGDGQTHDYECDLPVPYVHMMVDPSKLVSETDRLVKLLSEQGVKLEPMNQEGTTPTVDGGYSPLSGLASISLWNVMLE